MKFKGIFLLSFVSVLFSFLFGCSHVRTYTEEKERVDQNLVQGNQGYLSGQSEGSEALGERKLTRKTYVAEVELGGPAKKKSKKKVMSSEQEPMVMETVEEPKAGEVIEEVSLGAETKGAAVQLALYTVEPNDTLQKISLKIFGTTKKWKKIFDANSDKLKTPDRIYAGQVLKIPQE